MKARSPQEKGYYAMTEMPPSERNGDLRVRPESRTKRARAGAQELLSERSLLHELRMLQVEVELQSEERRRIQAELEAANASLKRNGTQLRDLAVELTLAEERERKRLAAILHDHLQQFIVAAQMKIGLLKRRLSEEDQARVILETRDILNEAAKASQSLAADLHPPILLDGGLMAGLHWLTRRMMTEHGLEVEVTGEDATDVPEHISILLFQAVRELLLNVVKHADVDRASVDLLQPKEGLLRVVVADRGRGFSPDAVIDGFGLFHLRERICHIGGACDVMSSPGNGARFCMTVAFDPQPRSSSTSSSNGFAHTHQNGHQNGNQNGTGR